MKFGLHHHSSFSTGNQRLKSLVFVLLLSLVGQVWAVPDVCSMMSLPANETTSVSQNSAVSPCHSMNSADASNTEKSHVKPIYSDCCDDTLYSGTHANSHSEHLISQHDCSCPDSGCATSFTMMIGFTSAVNVVYEQAQYYATRHFANRVSSSLYRPPIA